MATANAFRAFKSQSSALTHTAARPSVLRQSLTRRQGPGARRHATTDAAAAAGETPAQSGFAKFYNSPIGPKTVHFWAPVFKWAVAIAGAADFFRPASALSLTQNGALLATGSIWTRWCFVIKPRNVALASVNFVLACVGATQCARIFLYRQSLKDTSVGDEIKNVASSAKETVEGIASDPKGAAKRAANP